MTTEKPWKKHPMPIGEAADTMLSEFSEKSRLLLANTPKYLLGTFNLGWGLFIRDRLGLWNYYLSSPIPREAVHLYAEGESSLILEMMWEKLQGDERYLGLLRDPTTGDQLPEEMRDIDFGQYLQKTSYYNGLVKAFATERNDSGAPQARPYTCRAVDCHRCSK